MQPSIIRLMLTLALTIFAAPLTAEAQQAPKVYRIGFLHPGSALPEPASLETLRQGMRALGYVEGQNLVMEYRYAEEREERLPDLAAELVRLNVEVIVAGGTAATRAAQHATRTIPIVMTGTNDPVGAGFVASLARPEGNITGLSFLGAELPGKRLELLKEAVPQSTRVAVLANPASPTYDPVMHSLTGAARALGLSLHLVEVRRAEELESAFAAMTHAGADTLIVLSAPALMAPLQGRVVDLAAERRLPAIYDWKFYVESGGLMSYGPSFQDISRRTATYVDKLLKGATPADLPVEQAIKFELGLNLKTAKALGITFPPTLLIQADEVIR